jgi:DNA-binding XRE family transcriptional regulator
MSARTKKHHTKSHTDHGIILHMMHEGHVYNIPISVAKKYEDKSKTKRIPPEDIFGNIEKQYTKVGVLLRGTRYREGLTQAEMAKKINVTQADLSKMENGKRPIGKVVAKRIAKIFGVDYRYFL